MIVQISPSPRKANSCTPTISASFGVGYFALIIFQMPVEGNANDCPNDIFRVCKNANASPVTRQLSSRYTAKPVGTNAIHNHRGFHRRLVEYFCAASTASVGTRTAPVARVSQQNAPSSPATPHRSVRAARTEASARARTGFRYIPREESKLSEK